MEHSLLLKVFIFILLACSLIQANSISQAGTLSSSTGKLQGVLVTENEARVISTSIIIERKDFRRQLSTDAEGRFQAEVPPGIYRITINAPGFRQLRRKNLRVESDSTKTIKFILRTASGPDYSKCKGPCL